MTKMMTQIDLMTTHVMGGGSKIVNVVALGVSKSYDDDYFEALYNEEVYFLSKSS